MASPRARHLLCLAVVVVLYIAAARAGGFGGPTHGLQPNPFGATSVNAKLEALEQKADANSLIPDPPPGQPGRGPDVHRHIDSSSACTIGLLHALNENHVAPIVSDLVKTPYFRYFKVATDVECPFWVMNRMCKSGGGCHVCRCDDNEVPLPWRVEASDKAVFNPLPLGECRPARSESLDDGRTERERERGTLFCESSFF